MGGDPVRLSSYYVKAEAAARVSLDLPNRRLPGNLELPHQLRIAEPPDLGQALEGCLELSLGSRLKARQELFSRTRTVAKLTTHHLPMVALL